MKKICPVCGWEFSGRPLQKFCSRKCANVGKQTTAVPRCVWCKDMTCPVRDMQCARSPKSCPKRKNPAPMPEPAPKPRKSAPKRKPASRPVLVRKMEPGEMVMIMRSERKTTWSSEHPPYAYTALCPDPEYRR